MATKRAAAKAEAATMVDLEERLAPFFQVPVPGVLDQKDDGAEREVAWTAERDRHTRAVPA